MGPASIFAYDSCMHAIAELALVAVGGALGAVLRHLVVGPLAKISNIESWLAIVGVNTLGSLFAGVLLGLMSPDGDPVARAFLLVGIAGGLTTFSTAMLDAWVFFATRRRLLGVVCLLGTPVLAIGGAMVGRFVGGAA